MNSSLSRRIAERLSRHTGSDSRAQELRSHLAEAETSGHPITTADVGSIALLAARSAGARAARDLPWWLAGFPVAFLLFVPPVLSYETHFFAWDMIEVPPADASARFWKRAVDVLLITSFLFGLVAGRRCIEHLRNGRVALPGLLLLSTFVAGSQVDLFVERTPWWRDGGLQESHINEVPMYSVALITMFTALPALFVLIDVFLSRRDGAKRLAAGTVNSTTIDGRAVVALVLPFLHLAVGPLWLLPFLLLVWLAPVFSRRLKVTATLIVVVPVASLIIWGLANTSTSNDPLDDGIAIVLGVFVSFLAVWLRMAFVALQPLRTMKVDVRFSERALDSDAVG